MKARCKLWIEEDGGETLFGEGALVMFEAIGLHGSMNRAARDLSMSYRTLWGRVHELERRFGFPLVETLPGGGPGCGTRLLPATLRLMEGYRNLKTRTNETMRRAAEGFLGCLRKERVKAKKEG